MRVMFILLSVLLTACASTNESATTYAHSMQTSPTKANVFILSDLTDGGRKHISVDGKSIGDVAGYRMLLVQLDEGEHTIHAQITLSISESYTAYFKAGHNYYLLVDDDMFPSPSILAVITLLSQDTYFFELPAEQAELIIKQSAIY